MMPTSRRCSSLPPGVGSKKVPRTIVESDGEGEREGKESRGKGDGEREERVTCNVWDAEFC